MKIDLVQAYNDVKIREKAKDIGLRIFNQYGKELEIGDNPSFDLVYFFYAPTKEALSFFLMHYNAERLNGISPSQPGFYYYLCGMWYNISSMKYVLKEINIGFELNDMCVKEDPRFR